MIQAIQLRLMMLLLPVLLLVLELFSCPTLALDPLTVCPPSVGCVKGTHRKGYQSERFEAFMGIPYALPPVGELRFSNPKVMPKLLGVYDATKPKPDCVQKNYLLPTPIVFGQEDCLYLNIYRPQLPRAKQSLLPVMVYIHGGGFFSGSAGPEVTGPEYFMDSAEVILVTMAYRLGPFGFLSTQDSAISGNFGLKDQNLALRWVQRNIEAFGGDPKRVTIFGQSAGGVATHLHLLSPRSKGLFHGVISTSGTANVPFAITEQPLAQARLVAELCGIKQAQNLSTAKLARALRHVEATKLLDAGDGLKFWDVDHMTNFRPVVEQGVASAEAFLREHPSQLVARGSRMSIPWLVGTVPDEGAVRVVNIMGNETLRKSFNDRFDELLQELMEFPTSFSEERQASSIRLLVKEYFGDVHEVNEKTVQGFMDLITDRGFKHPLYNAIRGDVRQRHPLYLFSFNYRGFLSYASAYTSANVSGRYGVVHCDDLLYLFRTPLFFPDFERNSTEAKVIHSLVDYFVHFAKFGKPRNIESLTPCTESLLQSRPSGMCDYQEYVNSPAAPKGFEVHVSSAFQRARVQLWSSILNETSLNEY